MDWRRPRMPFQTIFLFVNYLAIALMKWRKHMAQGIGKKYFKESHGIGKGFCTCSLINSLWMMIHVNSTELPGFNTPIHGVGLYHGDKKTNKTKAQIQSRLRASTISPENATTISPKNTHQPRRKNRLKASTIFPEKATMISSKKTPPSLTKSTNSNTSPASPTDLLPVAKPLPNIQPLIKNQSMYQIAWYHQWHGRSCLLHSNEKVQRFQWVWYAALKCTQEQS